jgi:intracellular multiplication protein IcmP
MAAGQGQNNDSNDTVFLWGSIVIVLFMMGGWYFFHDEVARFVMRWHQAELHFLLRILTLFSSFLTLIHLPALDLTQMNSVLHHMQNMDYHDETYQSLFLYMNYIGSKTRYLFGMIIALLALISFFFIGGQRFRETYSMSSLAKSEKKNWPQITPVLSLDLLKKDLDEGPWAMAMQPVDFCYKTGILDEAHTKKTGEILFLEKKAAKVFALQLGSPWRGVRNLPIYAKALFVILAASASYERGLSEKISDQISRSADSGSLNFEGIDALVARFEKEDYVTWLDQTHAYVGTWLASMLAISRNSGVLATASFLWLKPVDRRLWYILNTIGRKTAVPEVSGLYAHWLAECKLGRALKTPMVKQAVLSLEDYLANLLVKKEGSQWADSVA